MGDVFGVVGEWQLCESPPVKVENGDRLRANPEGSAFPIAGHPSSQRRPSGAVTIPGENTGGYDQDSGQQQITEAYRRPAPHPSPLFPGNHMLPQVDEFFSGSLQQDLGQQKPALLMRGPQHETPYNGHNSLTPFTGSEPSSRSQSQAPSGSREGGYQHIYSFRQPQQVAPLRMDPYQHVPNTLEDQVQDLNVTVARLVSEVARLTESNQHLLDISQRICLDNAQMSVAHEKLSELGWEASPKEGGQ
ncbi:hypothetical protein EV702DRAFT_1049956 [Suillus placidus]|uniref:Uncharacterized protein n=1 Tax=Suillus placidus TaxID=48579 RepID=A0A9P6ZJL7_9AGAM|nr:hypothetical protein EV702DRAFT_1049956 [Suillus placidus]